MKIRTISLEEKDFVDPEIWEYVLNTFNIEEYDANREEDTKTIEFQTAFILVDSLKIFDEEFIEKEERTEEVPDSGHNEQHGDRLDKVYYGKRDKV